MPDLMTWQRDAQVLLVAAKSRVRQSMTTRFEMPVVLVKLLRDIDKPVDQIARNSTLPSTLGQDRQRVGIPLGDALTAFDLLAVLDAAARAPYGMR